MNEHAVNQFLRIVGERRYPELEAVLAPDVVLRWITPGGTGERAGAGEVVDRYRTWFGNLSQVNVLSARSETMGSRFPFAYRFRVCKPDGDWYIVQQQGVLDAGDAGITAIDLVCTGFLTE